MSESTAYRTIRRCEDMLITSGAFTLPGKRALLHHEQVYKVVLIDATTTPTTRLVMPAVIKGGNAALNSLSRRWNGRSRMKLQSREFPEE